MPRLGPQREDGGDGGEESLDVNSPPWSSSRTTWKFVPPKPNADLVTGLEQFSRQALHAGALGLSHPVTREQLSWKSPLPADFASLVKLLTADLSSNA